MDFPPCGSTIPQGPGFLPPAGERRKCMQASAFLHTCLRSDWQPIPTHIPLARTRLVAPPRCKGPCSPWMGAHICDDLLAISATAGVTPVGTLPLLPGESFPAECLGIAPARTVPPISWVFLDLNTFFLYNLVFTSTLIREIQSPPYWRGSGISGCSLDYRLNGLGLSY